MSRPGGSTERGRVIVVSVIVGMAIVVAAAAGAAAFVNGREDPAATAAAPNPSAPSSGSSAPSAPQPPESLDDAPLPPAPTVPGTDRHGFLGTPARCADIDPARMIVQTATSQAVVCARGDALYYAGWRSDTGVGTRIDGVLPAGPGWVARAPDATINITPQGLVISTATGEFTEPATAFWAG
ncbi:Serine/threonine protein kinase OS=Tsukamurella paurometabola (strain ATCC 8368 / DSM / CCUG 35730 / CIP 100753 / JCM 10117 / KCTC 9821 / NBRC 16120 / NCIMB 702349 / NCTC 13040) OX=521096 GN=Tpau_0981 PE=4 SV=1 [Tsukamurella paurometabola]|uniref:Serine/threonine protein kinase n=1 Tax=Tsukamurella paurometabola (strain ATCC 8368 / DSM 20162 / CCUG 35730 / CIP 100753 / JCM 10117 / KCTC 9821 / NBRC 16120 / NCIMB 702349 / NCTC 13040) TaxID=521096 RepID=D5UUP3_TSUPD|nr:hypothetical protein [Tsukamurella paurometabola]ADG77614.1 conserved hypothetical protein [Tsukamurella paurometabola DSM 20162]SUP27938.1 Uncharacterised protein [Tsukamurella paurometabola]